MKNKQKIPNNKIRKHPCFGKKADFNVNTSYVKVCDRDIIKIWIYNYSYLLFWQMCKESEVEYLKPKIVKANSLKETSTSERALIAENYSTEGISIAQARIKPGITTMAHHLDGVNEIYLITSGKGQVDVGDIKPTEVTKGDLVVIPAGASQRISNIGKTDLVFYCICTPKFTAECYCGEETDGKTK